MSVWGKVAGLWRWPVKSMAGESVGSLRVDWRGAGGDRTHALWFEHKGSLRPLTAREAPGLLRWRASYPDVPGDALAPAAPPCPVLVAPDGGRFTWGDHDLAAALAADLGRPILTRRDNAGQQDLERSVLVTTRASHVALEAELEAPVDLRRFRTNLHLELDAPAWVEEGWEGGSLAFDGGVTLRLLHPCRRCVIPTRDPDDVSRWPGLLKHLNAAHGTRFGINSRVETAGSIAVGERVALTVALAG